MKQPIAARVIEDLPGFAKREGHFVGMCNDDVVLGYCLDAPPGSLFVCRFALPTYDNTEFLHLSLGGRILDLAKDNYTPDQFRDFISDDWNEFVKTSDRRALVRYISSRDFGGIYPLWTKYLTYIRDRAFQDAERLETKHGGRQWFPRLRAIADSYSCLTKVRSDRGWSGCLDLLENWMAATKAKYG